MQNFFKKIIIFIIRIYQNTFGIWKGNTCMYHPTCSEYAILSIQKHGPLRGVWKSIKRILSCHPFAKPRVDYP